MDEISRHDVLRVFREFADLGGTSLRLAAWEFGLPATDVSAAWQALIDEQLIVPVGLERGETMYQLTASGHALAHAEPVTDRPPIAATAMIRLVYVSRAVAPMDEATLTDLLQLARARNHDQAVTGLLVYARESFMQVLEGHPSSVATIFRSIGADPRHGDIRILVHEPIVARRYAEWWMGFRALDPGELGRHLPGYQWPLRYPLIAGVHTEPLDVADQLLERLAPPA